jgi:hypothetical protein
MFMIIVHMKKHLLFVKNMSRLLNLHGVELGNKIENLKNLKKEQKYLDHPNLDIVFEIHLNFMFYQYQHIIIMRMMFLFIEFFNVNLKEIYLKKCLI